MKTVVLLSGGLDSVVNFKRAIDQGEVRLALTFDYGQAAAASELKAASLVAGRYGVSHTVLGLPWYKEIAANPVLGSGELRIFRGRLPADREGHLREAWIPNRNCVFLAIGAAYTEALGADAVVVGLNREEAAVFPDNSVAFLEAINKTLAISTLSGVRAVSYTADMTKAEIVSFAREIEAPLDLVYSCYKASADQRMCGLCQSCVRVKAALGTNGLLERYQARFAV